MEKMELIESLIQKIICSHNLRPGETRSIQSLADEIFKEIPDLKWATKEYREKKAEELRKVGYEGVITPKMIDQAFGLDEEEEKKSDGLDYLREANQDKDGNPIWEPKEETCQHKWSSGELWCTKCGVNKPKEETRVDCKDHKWIWIEKNRRYICEKCGLKIDEPKQEAKLPTKLKLPVQWYEFKINEIISYLEQKGV